jgi:hypothetical protein
LGLGLLAERSPESMQMYSYLTFFAPMILILFAAGKLRLLVTGLMVHAGWFVAHLCGLAS